MGQRYPIVLAATSRGMEEVDLVAVAVAEQVRKQPQVANGFSKDIPVNLQLRRNGIMETRRFTLDGPTTTLSIPIEADHMSYQVILLNP